jgi:hypothetical protein
LINIDGEATTQVLESIEEKKLLILINSLIMV